MKKLLIIVPCLNEEEVLPATDRALHAVIEDLVSRRLVAAGSGVLYVDDGSTDGTWRMIQSLCHGNGIQGIRLSRNFGHQGALLAGLTYGLSMGAETFLTIDADLQDDCSVIGDMVERCNAGADIVYGVRAARGSDSVFKRMSADAFYSLMRSLGGPTVSNHADFRLMSKRAVEDLLEFEERNLFLRGMVPLLGYRQEFVEYERLPRSAGSTKYPLSRMLDFAANGITSFSVRPVRMLFWIGLLFIFAAIVMAIYVVARYIDGETIEGWTSLMLSIWFCTGVILMGLGIIGEYVGKIYIETKHRPRFKIAETAESSVKGDVSE